MDLRRSKCISATKRMLCYNHHVCILAFFHAFVCSLLLRCVLTSSALRAGVKTLYNTITALDLIKLTSIIALEGRETNE